MTFILASSFGKLHGEIFFFTRIELDDDDMHSKQCTQRLFWFNGESDPRGIFCVAATLPGQRGMQPGFRSTPFPLA